MPVPVHNGVLLPPEMFTASTEELDAYAESVKRGNRAFIAAAFALEDEAARLGVELDTTADFRVGDRVVSGKYEGVIREVDASGVAGMHVVRFPGGDALRPTEELRKVSA